jgi:hypothetical protein
MNEVIIDDYWVTHEESGEQKLTFVNGPLWIMAIEKAMAKRFGSYERLLKLKIEDALFDLTGAPCMKYDYKA